MIRFSVASVKSLSKEKQTKLLATPQIRKNQWYLYRNHSHLGIKSRLREGSEKQ
jgi:hypothetical protein